MPGGPDAQSSKSDRPVLSGSDAGGAAKDGSTITPKDSGTKPATDGNTDGMPPTATLAWQTCTMLHGAPFPAGDLECATLSVPEDYAKPSGKHIDIEVTRIKAKDSQNRIGILLVNPGGPGATGDDLPDGLTATPNAKLLDRFDIIGFNPRGTGGNTSTDCAYAGSNLDPGMTPEQQLAYFEDQTKGLAAACTKKYGGNLLLAATKTTARDMDEIRKALGEQTINYLGYSYGTWLGPVYALEFPDRVRAMILDSTMLPEGDFMLLGKESAQASERTLVEFAKTCKADPACALAKVDPVATLDRAMAKADVMPIATGIMDYDLGSSDLLSITSGMLMDPTTWGDLAGFISAAADVGDNRAAASATSKMFLMKFFEGDSGGGSGGSGDPMDPGTGGPGPGDSKFPGNDSHDAILCADIAQRPMVKAFVDNVYALKPAHPHFYDWAYDGVDCVHWPAAPEPVKIAPVKDPAKLLIIGTYSDPNTLYEWSERLAKGLGGTKHIRYDGYGHGNFLNGNACVDQQTYDFLVSLKAPAQTTCAATPPNFKSEVLANMHASRSTPVTVKRPSVAVRPRPSVGALLSRTGVRPFGSLVPRGRYHR